jgi:hypothetical protein
MALLVLYSLEDKQMKAYQLVPEVHNLPTLDNLRLLNQSKRIIALITAVA